MPISSGRPGPPRLVPAFTVQSRQKNVRVLPSPRIGIYKEKRPKSPTAFRQCYLRGDLPISGESEGKGQKVVWKVDIEKLDYHHYLPTFFEGLCELHYPYKNYARQGLQEMLQHGGNKILPVIPQLIIPIKNALNTKNKEIMCQTLQALQDLVMSCDLAGEALVPYYRQILPVLNLYKEKNVNCGDDIDYSQVYRENVGDLVQETLEILERYGGEDAFINIKYMIPTYESCLLN